MEKSIKFIEATEADVPRGITKISGSALEDLKKIFGAHIAPKGQKAASTTGKQPCHIITCSVTPEGVTCWYHCVKH